MRCKLLAEWNVPLDREIQKGAQGIATPRKPSVRNPTSYPDAIDARMRSARIVTCEENLHGRLLSERVEDFQAVTLRRGVSMAQVSSVRRRMIEHMTVRKLAADEAAPIRMPKVRLDARTCSELVTSALRAPAATHCAPVNYQP